MPQGVVAAEFNVKFAHVLVADTPAGRAAEMFAKLVGERTKGRVEVKVFPAGQLGNDTQIVEQVQLNTVQMGIPPTAVLGQFEPRLQLIDLPFLFPKREACYEVLDGEVGQDPAGGALKEGVQGTGLLGERFQAVYDKRENDCGSRRF